MNTKPIIRWPGGKTRLLSHLLPLLRPHTIFVEAFAGGAALTLAKEPSKVEVINDINGELVNLYRHAQYHLDALIQEVEFTLNARAELEALIEQPGLTGLQQAARYLLRNRLSFGGSGTSFAVCRKHAQPSRAAVLEKLRDFNARLDKVAVENLSYERLVKNYDSPGTLWFFDPPYTAGDTGMYAVWNHEEMAAFAGVVSGLQGDWIVTVNDAPENRALFKGHEIQAVETPSGAGNRRIRPDATFGEVIIRRRIKRSQTASRKLLAA
ncbi:DNA adenine methylase [Prosthecobacter vanneervenii]|uniref:site-specific DNA-methyltransferase (adenine-specific) n=1 Tax=Prosthecobacter vanneervenii TaxID=48466 RepID=A0A7W7YBI2_9BACT|nr:DNA adenine methylase [Prosthecobacter vanneervenii]MBB5033131.1 DNA adenine methylase [Prosthecobacter vanneervenii]